MSNFGRAVIEFVDDRQNDTVIHTVRRTRINGVDVPILSDYEIVSGGGKPTSVKMELLVSEIHFVHEDKALQPEEYGQGLESVDTTSGDEMDNPGGIATFEVRIAQGPSTVITAADLYNVLKENFITPLVLKKGWREG